MSSKELGKEFWGILLFETHIMHLYQLLNIEKYNKSLSDFVDWIIQPENIPPDSQKIFITILQNRLRLAQYQEILTHPRQVIEFKDDYPSIRPLSQKEKDTQDVVVELLKLKYQNKHLQPTSFFVIYDLIPYERFAELLNNFAEKSLINKYDAADYLIHYKNRDCVK